MQFLVLRCQLGEGLQVWYFEVWLGGCGFGGAGSGAGRCAVHPDGLDSERLGRDHIVVDALPDVQPLAGTDSGALLSEFEYLQRWFVSPRLLRGDHVVEGHFEAAGSGGEKVVVNVGDDRELVARLEFAEGGDRIRERQPVGQRVRQGTYLGFGRRESQTLAEALDDRLENLAIRTELALFGLGFDSE